MFSHWSRPKPNASEGGWVIYSDLQEILLITLGVLEDTDEDDEDDEDDKDDDEDNEDDENGEEDEEGENDEEENKLSSDESHHAMKVIMWWKSSIDESYQVMKVIK